MRGVWKESSGGKGKMLWYSIAADNVMVEAVLRELMDDCGALPVKRPKRPPLRDNPSPMFRAGNVWC